MEKHGNLGRFGSFYEVFSRFMAFFKPFRVALGWIALAQVATGLPLRGLLLREGPEGQGRPALPLLPRERAL